MRDGFKGKVELKPVGLSKSTLEKIKVKQASLTKDKPTAHLEVSFAKAAPLGLFSLSVSGQVEMEVPSLLEARKKQIEKERKFFTMPAFPIFSEALFNEERKMRERLPNTDLHPIFGLLSLLSCPYLKRKNM